MPPPPPAQLRRLELTEDEHEDIGSPGVYQNVVLEFWI